MINCQSETPLPSSLIYGCFSVYNNIDDEDNDNNDSYYCNV